jgi:alkanesulfonate monooxygenase SsuD/methylene tetrahydromethanopterin reductase-like flavin-dependent oxidoreductase (luciferase family)
MIEAIELIRRLWTGEKVSFDGCYYQTKKAKLYTLPKNEIPIYIFSLVPESAYIAGYYGDGLLTVGGGEGLEKPKQILPNLKKGPETQEKMLKVYRRQ